ncbi:KilA-N domain-containing protein [Thiothrix sp.]|jgi:transcription termination factor NusB|uniref:KilA-N domain-containing protein n=1 Tax=Thiothrix sp. TaxID=1032 RepID=UPI00257F67AC|nr:KilA-N domain-containing protein [Thiothrix sp.]
MAAANISKSELITNTVHGVKITVRSQDGYCNATSMCKAAKKNWHDFSRLTETQKYIAVVEAETGIPASELIQSLKGGNKQQGTWIHPDIALNLAQWLDAKTAYAVTKIVKAWMSGESRQIIDPEFIMIHKSVLQDTGRALVWMGDYGVTSQPFYGNAGQPPFVDGRPVMAIGDSSTRYYLTKYVGNVMENQRLATEEVITNHLRRHFPALEIVSKAIMRSNLMQLANELVNISGQFITSAEINKGMDKAMQRGAV